MTTTRAERGRVGRRAAGHGASRRLGAVIGLGASHATDETQRQAARPHRSPARRSIRIAQGSLLLVSLLVVGPGLVGGRTPAASAAASPCPGGANQCVTASP
ncbi:MAG TPA: hypothetical protein VMF60_05485, partial [Acidimicrobiales bacterium]|nr:hypothetical protein [Acidimicrobiales bacterium]